MCVPYASGVFTSGKVTHNAFYVYVTIKFSRFFCFFFTCFIAQSAGARPSKVVAVPTTIRNITKSIDTDHRSAYGL